MHTSHRHHDCIFTDGQAREEEPSHNKLFWNGTVFSTVVCICVSQCVNDLELLFLLSLMKAASMLLLSLSFTWKALAPYSGTLAVVGTVL